MFCTNCGKQVVEGARFCNYCGTKIVDFDEKQAETVETVETAGIGTDNPVSDGANSVLNSENVENSGNLLKTAEQFPNYVPKMNELPKSGYSPDSVPVSQEPTIAPVSSILPSDEGASERDQGALTDDIGGSLSNAVPPISPVSSISPNGEAASEGDPSARTDDLTGSLSNAVSPTSPVSSISTNGVPISADKENKPERRYTLAHLVMCLASTAVMAIAAGIFAGLYFSVV